MIAIEGFDEEMVEELRNRAKSALTTLELANEEAFDNVEPAEDLLNMDGMDRRLAYQLARHGVITMEDLAEQAIDDLLAAAPKTSAADLLSAAPGVYVAQPVV